MKYPFLDLDVANEPYRERLEEAALRVIRSGRYIGGTEVELFEKELAAYHKAPHAVGVSNGLDALRLILRAAILMGRLSPGDEVIVPANTYIASILAITDSGLTPVLVDASAETLNLNTSLIQNAITGRTRAIMLVHLYGKTVWDDNVVDAVKKHDLFVVEDCAQAIGARATTDGLFGSRHAGALGHAGAFSFYPTKNIGALGDAGAVVTHDEQLAATVRALANYGSDRRYHNIYAGFNCRLDPIQAAMLRVKLPYTDSENAARFARAMAYERTITNPAVIKPVITPQVIDNVWHQYIIRVPADRRDSFREQLAQKGVGTDIHYATPPHRQPCYTHLNHGPIPVTEQLAAEMVSLPIATGTSVTDASEIAGIINSIDL